MSKTQRLISIVVPVYFNGESLIELAGRLCAAGQTLLEDVDFEYIFVNDGSRDDSLDRLMDVHRSYPGVTVVSLSRNFGGVNAIKAGLRVAKGDAVIIMAADLQDPPELVPDLVRAWLQGNRFVVCERLSRNDSAGVTITSKVYHWILRKAIISTYPTGGFDMLLVDRQMVDYLKTDAKAMYPQVLAYWLGFEPCRIHYERPARRHGKSRWTTKKRLAAFSDIIFGYSAIPIHIATIGGIFIAVSAFAYAAILTALRLLGHAYPAGFSVLAVLVAFTLGSLLLTVGVVGQYVWRVYDQISGRPDVVVDFVRYADSRRGDEAGE